MKGMEGRKEGRKGIHYWSLKGYFSHYSYFNKDNVKTNASKCKISSENEF